ncbi:MAG: hypothetical protein U0X91_06075 [Spirosomataceae bacterium]
MKHFLFSLLSLFIISSGCTKEDTLSDLGGNIPAATVGKWMYGSFSMSDFWSYDGQYQGKPFELAVVFDFKSNGTYEKYFIASNRDYSNCRTEAFTFEKGRVSFDETTGTFTTVATEGTYRGFYSCFPKNNINRKMTAAELKTQTYYYKVINGSTGKNSIEVRFTKNDPNVSTFFPTSW